MADEWQKTDKNYYEDKWSKRAVSPLTQPGINRQLPLYLNESYAVPAQECWMIAFVPVCYIRTEQRQSFHPPGDEHALRYLPRHAR